jgi:hypothetical protein
MQVEAVEKYTIGQQSNSNRFDSIALHRAH